MRPPGVVWTGSEAAAVNQFLGTPVGIKWLRELWSRKPKIDYTSVEKAALSGSFAAGYEKAWEEISNTRIAAVEPDNASIRAIDPTKD